MPSRINVSFPHEIGFSDGCFPSDCGSRSGNGFSCSWSTFLSSSPHSMAEANAKGAFGTPIHLPSQWSFFGTFPQFAS
ncbi:hypothetical protein L596_011071 [Steinernema carpocapsae]|uniref:Uncharacterized protein n=1 Tax=Steinernema carpocapsae TaxID=34508 RepID=A0A4V6A4D3_STECR|nr:hypothetical protein L596_011071 [Steinernema carpocapsae]